MNTKNWESRIEETINSFWDLLTFRKLKSLELGSKKFILSYLDLRPVVPRLPGLPWDFQILANQLTLSQPKGAVYAHQIILTALPTVQDLSYVLREHNDSVHCVS